MHTATSHTITTQEEIEDHFGYVLTKAMAGLRISSTELAATTGATIETLREWRHGQFHDDQEEQLLACASALNLSGPKLLALAKKEWFPQVRLSNCLHTITMPFGKDMTVNSFVLALTGASEAIVFDAGTCGKPVLGFLEARKLKPVATLITHNHPDHTSGLRALQAGFPDMLTFAHPDESLESASPLDPGEAIELAGFHVTPKPTPGHSRGGTTFLVRGDPDGPIAIVGDALFAGSIGGVRGNYSEALEAIRKEILSLSTETILCPGHGPLTTVGNERCRNPFFDFEV